MEITYGEKGVLLAEEVVKKDGGMKNSRSKKEGLPLFVRDDLPPYSGIVTFLKSLYIENLNYIKDLNVTFILK